MKIKIGRFQWNSRIEHRRMALLMLVALVALVAGITVLVGIVRLPVPTPRPAAADHGALNLVNTGGKKQNSILEEEARLLDPTPLFLPTPYNYSQPDSTILAQREPDQAFRAYPALYAYSDDNFSIQFPDPAPVPAQPVDVLDFGRTQTPFATLGRAELPATPLTPRLACVDVVQAGTGRVLLTLPIAPPDPLPAGYPEPLAAGELWPPMEFLATIDVTGLIGAPTHMKGTASSVIVQYFASYIEKNLHLGARREIPAGTYILRVGP